MVFYRQIISLRNDLFNQMHYEDLQKIYKLIIIQQIITKRRAIEILYVYSISLFLCILIPVWLAGKELVNRRYLLMIF